LNETITTQERKKKNAGGYCNWPAAELGRMGPKKKQNCEKNVSKRPQAPRSVRMGVK